MPAYRDRRTGRWRYRVWVTLPNGTRERITGTPATDTKSATEHAERMHVLRVTNPGLISATPAAAPPPQKEPPTTKTIREYKADFMAGYLPDQKPSERRSKEQILDGHILPKFGDLRLDEVLQHHVDAFVTQELRRGVTRKTVNNRLAVMSSLLKYAHENRLIPKPTLRLNLKRKGAPKAAPILPVPRDHVAKLVAAAKDDRYGVAVLLAAEAGLRVGEILGLQWTDLKDGDLHVRRAVDIKGNVGTPKHDKRRTVPLSPALEVALAALPRRGLWVVSRLDGDLLSYEGAISFLRDLYGKAGVPVPESETGERRPWHSLRHSFGTECAARGVPITTLQELMGHEDLATTRRYVTVSQAHKRDAVRLAFGQQVGNTLPKDGSK